MTSGERIKILRILNGYTQQTLADIADVSRASVMLWEKGSLPTRRIATVLSSLFEVNLEYLLEGINPPLTAIWKPIEPGHPKHLPALAADLNDGITKLFTELEINYAAIGFGKEKVFMLCGKGPKNPEWQLNYLLIYNRSLHTILTKAVWSTGSNLINIKNEYDFEGWSDFVTACKEELHNVYGAYPDCDRLYGRASGIESDDEDIFTLEGLFKRFGKVIAEQHLNDDDIETISFYVANEISKRSGFYDIKTSSKKLLQEAMQQTTKKMYEKINGAK